MLTYIEIAKRLRPRWIVWENVFGVLSSGRGRDLGAFLGALGDMGYGWAYRVLDAQWCRVDGYPYAVPQRRRRVFVVGCLGDATRAAAVLFECESVRRDSAARGAARQGAAADAAKCFAGHVESDVAAPLETTCHDYSRADGFNAVVQPVAYRKSKRAQSATDDESWVAAEIANTINAWDVGERDTHAIAFQQNSRSEVRVISGDGAVTGALSAESGMNQTNFVCMTGERDTHAIAFQLNGDRNDPGVSANAEVAFSGIRVVSFDCYHGLFTGEVATSLGRCGENAGAIGTTAVMAAESHHAAVESSAGVRRLTPRECERLQGFPDDWTAIPWRGRPAEECPDGPRYRAIGNSMAVNCMRWIGRRIAAAT